MKTIKAIFTKEKHENPTCRAYSFNIEQDVQVGDLLESPDYKGKLLQVTSIEDDVYNFFSFKTGGLYKELIPGCGQIKTLSPETAIVDATMVSENYKGF